MAASHKHWPTGWTSDDGWVAVWFCRCGQSWRLSVDEIVGGLLAALVLGAMIYGCLLIWSLTVSWDAING